MDFGNTLKHLAPFLIPVIALMIPLLAIGINGWVQVRRSRELHESIRHLASAGQPVPAEFIKAVQDEDRDEVRPSGWSASANLRAGLISLGVGVGLMTLLYQLRSEGGLWAVGAIPACLGVALLVAWRIESRSAATPGARGVNGPTSGV